MELLKFRILLIGEIKKMDKLVKLVIFLLLIKCWEMMKEMDIKLNYRKRMNNKMVKEKLKDRKVVLKSLKGIRITMNTKKSVNK